MICTGFFYVNLPLKDGRDKLMIMCLHVGASILLHYIARVKQPDQMFVVMD